MSEIKLNLLDYKVLSVVYHLNKIDKYPNQNGVYKLVKGIVDDESKNYTNIPGFSSAISITSKRLSFKILMLIRHGFLQNIYDKNTDKMYLKIPLKGEIEITKYLSRHPNGFVSKTKLVEPSIITIKNKGK